MDMFAGVCVCVLSDLCVFMYVISIYTHLCMSCVFIYANVSLYFFVCVPLSLCLYIPHTAVTYIGNLLGLQDMATIVLFFFIRINFDSMWVLSAQDSSSDYT